MNTKVTVTGMEVHTRVSNNLLIAKSTTATMTKEAENLFKTNDVDHLEALLEPVSTVDGVTFFYTDTKNVDAQGDAASDAYIAYAAGDTFDIAYGVNDKNSSADAAGYVDYAFQLKAVNSDASNPQYINITNIDLLYNGTATTEKAYRVAIFVDDMGVTGSTNAVAPSASTLKTILRHDGATYFGSDGSSNAVQAVSATDTVSDVNAKIDDAAVIATVAAGATNYYKVVVRLWLEGEDTTCTNTTYANLKNDWALNLTIQLQNAIGTLVNLGKTNDANTANLASATVATSGDGNVVVIDGVSYYKVSVQLNSTALYTTDDTLYNDSKIYTISSGYLTDVTNQCTLPATARS